MFADDNAVGGDFGGIGEFVAELFIGENDSDAMVFGAEFVGEFEGEFVFGFCDRDEGVFGEFLAV